MIPTYLFRSPVDLIDDLNNVDRSISDLALYGHCKGLGQLNEFKDLKRVWLINANQKQFNQVVTQLNPEIFSGYGLRVADLSPLARFTKIRELALDWNTKATDINFLKQLDTLQVLHLNDFTKVRDLTPIRNLTGLLALNISGGVWNIFKVDTLEPLASLSHLQYLSLANIRVMDESLSPICRLSQLKELELSNQFPTEEYARLAACLTGTKCDKFRAYVDLRQALQGHNVMVVGKRKPFLNKSTDKDQLEKYEEEFARLVKAHKKQNGG